MAGKSNTSIGMDVDRETRLTGQIVTDEGGSLMLKQLDEFTGSKAYPFSTLSQKQKPGTLVSLQPQRRNAKSAHVTLTRGAMRECTISRRTSASRKLGLGLSRSKYKCHARSHTNTKADPGPVYLTMNLTHPHFVTMVIQAQGLIP